MRAKRVDLVNQPRVHSPAEVEQAAADLTRADLKRLRAVALTIFHRRTVDRDPDDLVSEALVRTLGGSRGWRKGVDFRRHLAQAMRSIAWKWQEREEQKERAAVARPVARVMLAPAEDGVAPESPERLLAPGSNPEAATIAREQVLNFFRAFADDAAASSVLSGWASGCQGPDIRRRHGMTEKELRAAIRRIRRFAQQGDHHGD